MYVLVSFDFGGSDNVAIHAVTGDRAAAERMWHVVSSKPRARPPPSYAQCAPYHVLVELWEFPDGYASEAGCGIFWGLRDEGATMLLTNNKEEEKENGDRAVQV
jgi:hypothetical protein